MNNTENNQGWIKLHRKILDSTVYTSGDAHLFQLWIYILLKVNHKKSRFLFNGEEITIKPGSGVFGLNQIVKDLTGLKNENKPKFKKYRSIYFRRLKLLQNMKNIELKPTNKFTIITVVNWDQYQQNETQVKLKRNSSETQVKTNKNDKNVKNEKNDNKINTELDKIRKHYNRVFGRDTKSTEGYRKNYLHWKEIHSTEKIMKAIDVARQDNFWKDKLTLTILFRRKSPQGEDVDYIEDISNRQTQGGGGHLALITD